MFESKIINLTKALADKDENINTLVKRLKDMEKCLLQVQKKKENLEVEIQSLEIETEVMKCDKCDFRTNSKREENILFKTLSPYHVNFVTLKQKLKYN